MDSGNSLGQVRLSDAQVFDGTTPAVQKPVEKLSLVITLCARTAAHRDTSTHVQGTMAEST